MQTTQSETYRTGRPRELNVSNPTQLVRCADNIEEEFPFWARELRKIAESLQSEEAS